MNRFHSNLKHIKLITFDVTDTLLTYTIPPAVEYSNAAKTFGLSHIDATKIQNAFRPHFKQMNSTYPNFGYNSELSTWDNWWRMLIKNIFFSIESNINEAILNDMIEHLLLKYESGACYIKAKKANEFIEKCRQDEKTVGVISNFDPRLKTIIKNTQLPAFDFVLTSYECGWAKPSNNIFNLALEKVNAKASEALHIGNTAKLDYIAAKEAGWNSVLITNDSNNWKEFKQINENHVFSSIENVFDKLETTETIIKPFD